jgi:hypothetical protein
LRKLAENLSLFPSSVNPVQLTLKQYESLVPHAHPEVLGPFGVAYTLPTRPDSITVQVAFGWSPSEVNGNPLSHDPAISSVYLGWFGSDSVVFDSLYRKIRAALRQADAPPVCIDLGTNVMTRYSQRRSREAGWRAGGWVGELFLRASNDSAGQRFRIQYRASRDSVFHVPVRDPKDVSWTCLPELTEVVPIRR